MPSGGLMSALASCGHNAPLVYRRYLMQCSKRAAVLVYSDRVGTHVARHVIPVGSGPLSWFGPGQLHYLRPLRSILDEKFLEIGQRARETCTAEIGEATPHARLGEDGGYLSVEPLDDLGTRALAQTNCPPLACLVAGHEFSHCWDVGQGFPAR